MRSWNDTYNILIAYKNTYGHTNVKFDEIFDDVNLGHWVALQRSSYRSNKLKEDQISSLNAIGFVFDQREVLWNTYFMLAKEYFNTFGDLNIPKRYVVSVNDETFALGKWLANQRLAMNENNNRSISFAHIMRLNSITKDWCGTKTSYNATSFNECAIAYYVKKAFPNSCKYKSGNIELDVFIPELQLAIEYDGQAWHMEDKDLKKNHWCKQHNISLVRVRENGCATLSNTSSIDFYINAYDVKELEDIIKTIVPNVDVDIARDSAKIHNFYRTSISQSWKDKYALCVEYAKENGKLNFSSTYITNNGVKLGSWLHEQRKSFKKNKLSMDKIKLLDNLGMVWVFA